MRRIDISYGGQWYTIGDRSLEEVHEEIRSGVLSGHHWLQVNEGEGRPRPAYLSITPGVPIAVVPETDPQDPPTEPPIDETDGEYDQPQPARRWTGPTIHTRRH